MSVNGLEGQVVIVTGASSGLGEQLAADTHRTEESLYVD